MKIEPQRWTPPPMPERAGRRTSSTPLPPLTVVGIGGHGPEDVLVAPDGAVFAGVDDGRVLRIEGSQVTQVASTGGRPLGLEWLPDGALLVCDARRGLLRVDLGSGAVEELVTEVDGVPMRFCNNADVQDDGTIWFTDSTTKWDIDSWRGDLVEHGATGRLLRRDPDGTVHVIRTGLAFANGVACAPDGSWVAVAETAAYTLLRVDPATKDVTPLEANLPGFPDNISRGSDGLIWVALASSRQAPLDRLLPRAPWLRKLVWALPEKVQPQPLDTVWVQAYRPDGTLVHDLQDTRPGMTMVTGVREHDGTVWLGSLTGTTVACFSLTSQA